MSLCENRTSGKKHLTEAQRKQQLDALKKDNRSHFANKETCGQVSLRRMLRPEGKIYKD